MTHEDDRLAVTLPFLERGVHALVEKPLALTVEEATKLRDAGAAHGVYVMPGHVLRFDARLMALKESSSAAYSVKYAACTRGA